MPKIEIQPFEICSIRPPTENYSLTFRLTRNCYWNKCAFCPVYKLGAPFSKRKLPDVFKDIDTAKELDDMLATHGLHSHAFSRITNDKIHQILEQIIPVAPEGKAEPSIPSTDLDPRLAWFLNWFKEKPSVEDNLNHLLTWHQFGARTCFLGDGDNLIVKPDILSKVIQKIRNTFPSVQRFTIYGRTKSAATVRTAEELAEFREAGLHRVHFGLESGSDKVLTYMRKGVTKQEHIEGGQKTREAGLSCSVYIMPGLGGQALSHDHAKETTDALNQIQPDYIRLRSLEIFPQTPLEKQYRRGDFFQATETQMIEEIKYWVETLNGPTELLSDSASNLLSINGRLPEDRKQMLSEIDSFLELPAREKVIFSAQSRLQSFMGQYGNVTKDIYQAIAPFICDGKLNLKEMPDDDLKSLITLIRSKLMP